MGIVVAKAVLSVVLILLTLGLYRLRNASAVQRLTSTQWSVPLAILVFRWLPFTAIYLFLGINAQSDVISYFWPQAVAAAQGEVVYRDFVSHYSPFFPYILSLAIHLWWEPRAIIVLMILIESITLWLANVFCQRYLSKEQCNYAALIYLMLPAPFVMIVLGGQEDVWLWTAGLLVIWLLVNDKPFWAGVVGGLGFLATKALFALPLAVYAVTSKRFNHYIIGVGLVGIVSIAVLWPLVGSKIFMPLIESSSLSPPNIWFLLTFINSPYISANANWLSLVSLGSVILIANLHQRQTSTPIGYLSGWVVLYCAVMFLSPKSLGNYVAIFCMPFIYLCIIFQDSLSLIFMLLLNFLASVQPSLWYRLGSPNHANLAFLDSFLHFTEFSMEIGMLFLLVVLIARSWKWNLLHQTVFFSQVVARHSETSISRG